MNCSTCKHSQPIIMDDDSDLVLVCRRYPPALAIDGDGDWTQLPGPHVGEDEVCGEWAENITRYRPSIVIRKHEKRDT